MTKVKKKVEMNLKQIAFWRTTLAVALPVSGWYNHTVDSRD